MANRCGSSEGNLKAVGEGISPVLSGPSLFVPVLPCPAYPVSHRTLARWSTVGSLHGASGFATVVDSRKTGSEAL